MTGPTFVPVSENPDAADVNKYNPILDESTDLESEESSRVGTPTSSRSSRVEEQDASFFDFAACCGFASSRGTCPLCHQDIQMSDAFFTLGDPDENGQGQFLLHMECYQNDQRTKAYNATKIQALARGKYAREELRREAAAREAAARRAFELERQAMEEAERAAMLDREQAPPKKKSLVKKLFGGCFGSKPAAPVEDDYSKPVAPVEDDYSKPAVDDDDDDDSH